MLEEKKLLFYLWEKLEQEVHRESKGTATEDTGKVVLECLDGFFGHVGLVVVQGNKFVCHIGGANGLLICRSCLVVQDLVYWDNAHLLHLLQGSSTGQDKFAAGVVLEGLHS